LIGAPIRVIVVII